MTLTQVIYASRLARPRSGSALLSELRDILRSSRKNNAAAGITGFLMMDASWNVQILEGPTLAVEETLERIRMDTRHTDLVVISRQPAARRAFPSWSMGAAMRATATREVFLNHGVDKLEDVIAMKPKAILDMALELAGHDGDMRATA